MRAGGLLWVLVGCSGGPHATEADTDTDPPGEDGRETDSPARNDTDTDAAGSGDTDTDETDPTDSDTGPPPWVSPYVPPTLSYPLTEVHIERGTFTMGRNPGPDAEPRFHPAHQVTLTHDYALGTYLVTREAYEHYTGRMPSHIETCDGCPIDRVGWADAAAFTNALSVDAGLEACYTCTGSAEEGTLACVPAMADIYECRGYRLPTEAEWEFAALARGTLPGDFPAGGDVIDNARLYECDGALTLDDGTRLSEQAWFCGSAPEDRPYPVGTLRPSLLGLHDLAGNLWEWCHDWYGAYPSEALVDPVGPPSGDEHAIRGGSYFDQPSFLRVKARYVHATPTPSPHQGIRFARTLWPAP